MCGRYTLTVSNESLAMAFHLPPIGFRVERRWNIAPGQHVIVIRPDRDRRIADMAQWGLVPAWSKDPFHGPRPINARAETVAEKPSFRGAFRHKRCLVPASGFYEWCKEGDQRRPYYIHPVQEELFAFAGLLEDWRGPAGELRTVCILTTTPNAVMAPLHDRMPVILPETAWTAWLDPEAPVQELQTMLIPSPDDSMATHPVDSAVGNFRNDGPANIKPLG